MKTTQLIALFSGASCKAVSKFSNFIFWSVAVPFLNYFEPIKIRCLAGIIEQSLHWKGLRPLLVIKIYQIADTDVDWVGN